MNEPSSIRCWSLFFALLFCIETNAADRPNILIAIADDQSYPHTSAYGDPAILTPGFDRVAAQGVLFRSAFTPAPGCSPMRAAFLTGRQIWQIREAGTHASSFPTDLPVFTNQLASAGYHVGRTGKGWGPGKAIGWPHNPAGPDFSKRKLKSEKGISSTDYAGNFDDFLAAKSDDQPFCFWFGSHEPHRTYDPGIGKRSGIDPAKVAVPGFLPDTPEIRSDIADYLYEIQWFDSHLVRMLDRLQSIGQLENTLVIVTSDNGMPFPRAKANLYEYGIHMPLAISWPNRVPAKQTIDDLVSLIDVTRTIFDATDVQPDQADELTGHSLIGRMTGAPAAKVADRDAVYSGRERHSSSRFHSLGYPCRCIRTKDYLYIRNFTPDQVRFDAQGIPVEATLGPMHGGYHDIDAGPSLTYLIKNADDQLVSKYLDLAVAIRPTDELFDVTADPGCLHNLASSPKHQAVLGRMSKQLTDYLIKTGDQRQTDAAAAQVWETYPRYSSLRWFETPAWATASTHSLQQQTWLEERRPK